MSERLTDEQLRKEMERIERDNDLAALRARVAQLEARCHGYMTSFESNCREIERLEAYVAQLEEGLRLAQMHPYGAALKDTPQ